MVMASLCSNRTLTKTEAGIRDWGSVVTGQPCFLLAEHGLLDLGLGKQLNV